MSLNLAVSRMDREANDRAMQRRRVRIYRRKGDHPADHRWDAYCGGCCLMLGMPKRSFEEAWREVTDHVLGQYHASYGGLARG